MSSERQPPGVPIGGQWAPTQHAEGEVDLPSVTDTERRWTAAQDHLDRHDVVDREDMDQPDAKRYLLLDSDRSGEVHASFWDDIEDAEAYQTEQESAEDWTPEIVDLDTGDSWDSWYQARTAVAAATPAPQYPEHDTFTFEDGVSVDASFTHPDSMHPRKAVDILRASMADSGAEIVDSEFWDTTASDGHVDGGERKGDQIVGVEYISVPVQVQFPGQQYPTFMKVECRTDAAFAGMP